jgi:hypothetical protein
MIVSLIFPFGGAAAQAGAELPVQLSLIPRPDGIEVLIHITPRRPWL